MANIHHDNFRAWFSKILEGLYSVQDAGFPILMISFPLLERYLREKSGVHEGNLLRQQSSTGMPVGECRPEIFWYKLMDSGKQSIRAYGISNRIPCGMDTKISEADPESWREGIPWANVAKDIERHAWGGDRGAEYPGGPYPHDNDHTPEVFG